MQRKPSSEPKLEQWQVIIGIIGLVFGCLAVVATIASPEIRRMFGFDARPTENPSIVTIPTFTVESTAEERNENVTPDVPATESDPISTETPAPISITNTPVLETVNSPQCVAKGTFNLLDRAYWPPKSLPLGISIPDGITLTPIAWDGDKESPWVVVILEGFEGWYSANVNDAKHFICSNVETLAIRKSPPPIVTPAPVVVAITPAPVAPAPEPAQPAQPVQPPANSNGLGTPVQNCTLKVRGHSSNLKTEPNGSLTIGVLPDGEYQAQRRSGTWFYIESGGQSGWVDGFWATVSPACVSESSGSNTIGTPVQNCTLKVRGHSSNLKAEPNGSLTIGVLPDGEYQAQRRSGNWFYIESGGQSGWVDGFWATVSPTCAN